MIYDIYIYIYTYIFGSDSGVYFLQHTIHWWDSTLPLPLHFSAPRRWHGTSHWPSPFSPQLSTCPSPVNVSVWRFPAATATTGPWAFSGSWHWPWRLQPKAQQWPVSSNLLLRQRGPCALKSLWVILAKWQVRVSERFCFWRTGDTQCHCHEDIDQVIKRHLREYTLSVVTIQSYPLITQLAGSWSK